MLRHFLNKIVSPLHEVFASGGFINDNILLAHEIMHSFKKKKKKGKLAYMVVKCDIEKAYDKVENYSYKIRFSDQDGLDELWNAFLLFLITY